MDESFYLTNKKSHKDVSSSCETSVVAVGCESMVANDSKLSKVGSQQCQLCRGKACFFELL